MDFVVFVSFFLSFFLDFVKNLFNLYMTCKLCFLILSTFCLNGIFVIRTRYMPEFWLTVYINVLWKFSFYKKYSIFCSVLIVYLFCRSLGVTSLNLLLTFLMNFKYWIHLNFCFSCKTILRNSTLLYVNKQMNHKNLDFASK